jgi:hypothetical protein
MGYVQSGKTANFTGVVARGADAGYRLIIVLAGTWNILRNQTQRRFDKDLLGKELLNNDEEYVLRPPPDWGEYLEHGANPSELGHYVWERLTRPDSDFRRLNAAIESLEFHRVEKALPIYNPVNLHSLQAKLLVVKKHSGILGGLVKDLKLIRTKLADVPTLIIDDESDQAGLNTVDPRRFAGPATERSKTNSRIVELLRLFPRGQYVGYTATPYANALTDPDDPEDLFPRDFIVSLDRPSKYMGISDFFDPATDYKDLDNKDYSLSEIAYIRRVSSPVGSDGEDLKKALRSYVLSGALKLYRLSTAPGLYKAASFKHHTMLIHTSQRKGEHASLVERLTELWNSCAFNGPSGQDELEKLWRDDFKKVCAAKGDELVPNSFFELVPHLSQAITRIEKGPSLFLVVNSDSDQAPDFSAAPVWKIVVGGNKLSRGYTIEGLTISYYRRVAGTADTLMQMGRWFGFRSGYRDLVRVFLGVAEGRRGDVDLVAQFKEVCRLEERFREEIERYVRTPGAEPITPKQIPPMIEVCGDLPPTSRNKMFNAVLAGKNFGGQLSTPTLAPANPQTMERNINSLEDLLGQSSPPRRCRIGWEPLTDVFLFETSNSQVVTFLEAYRWLETDYKYPKRPLEIGLQLEFLKKENHEIDSWLIIAPQRESSFGAPLPIGNLGELTVKQRKRIPGRGFTVFGEPRHRETAKFLVGINDQDLPPGEPNTAAKDLKNEHRGIFLLYPVREKEADNVSIGFELLFPRNKMQFLMNFTVRTERERGKIVVTNPGS